MRDLTTDQKVEGSNPSGRSLLGSLDAEASTRRCHAGPVRFGLLVDRARTISDRVVVRSRSRCALLRGDDRPEHHWRHSASDHVPRCRGGLGRRRGATWRWMGRSPSRGRSASCWSGAAGVRCSLLAELPERGLILRVRVQDRWPPCGPRSTTGRRHVQVRWCLRTDEASKPRQVPRPREVRTTTLKIDIGERMGRGQPSSTGLSGLSDEGSGCPSVCVERSPG